MSTSMDITFLGTSSAQPSLTRNQTAIALKRDGEIYLIDVGEATQHQILRCKELKLSKIKKIFITHLHGDHLFGLPGLLCTHSNQISPSEFETLEIYGPKGIRKYVRNSLESSSSHLANSYIVHEIVESLEEVNPDNRLHSCELEGGRNILPFFTTEKTTETTTTTTTSTDKKEEGGEGEERESDEEGVGWVIYENDFIKILASPLKHTVPCLGYVFIEKDISGKIDMKKVSPILKKNEMELKKLNPNMKNVMALLKKLQLGENLVMPDGEIIQPPKKRKGRKIVILGDTSDSLQLSNFLTLYQNHQKKLLKRNANEEEEEERKIDLLIHESTNAWVGEDKELKTKEEVRKLTMEHGHSTPGMAGEFGKLLGVEKIALTHFSSRYVATDTETMEEIRKLCIETFESEQVLCAQDFTNIEIKL